MMTAIDKCWETRSVMIGFHRRNNVLFQGRRRREREREMEGTEEGG